MSRFTIRNAVLGLSGTLGDVVVADGVIDSVLPGGAADDGESFEAAGRCIFPGFVDCHTHACWAGSRLDEWEQGLAGVSYLDILRAGGGIMSTVRAVRGASQRELADALAGRLATCLRHGTTTIEVKSGYGLTTEDELKMLRAIHDARARWPGTIVPTACIGHAKDPAEANPVGLTLQEVLPAVTREFPGITIDAYCEKGAWSVNDALRLLDAAIAAGHPVRVHADQFNDLGIIPEAVRRQFRSVDHLEASKPDHLALLAESDTFGVMLPMAGWHLDDRYADGASFLAGGGTLALGSNLNPGSAPCYSMSAVVAQATRKLKIPIEAALDSATKLPARLLGLSDRGELVPGQRADLVLLDTADLRDVAFFGGWNPVVGVWVAGRQV
ncbi:MAG: imidazolonepropionase [Planctomycetota bacterium]